MGNYGGLFCLCDPSRVVGLWALSTLRYRSGLGMCDPTGVGKPPPPQRGNCEAAQLLNGGEVGK